MHTIDANQNKLSIKTSKSFASDSKLILNFNGATRAFKYWGFVAAFHLYIRLEFRANSLYADKWPSDELIISNISYSSISSRAVTENDWPAAGDMSNRMKIWLGYDHDWISKSHSNWPTNQIIGCVELIDVNEKSIIFVKHGNDFYLDCYNRVTESICEKSQCRNETDNHQYILNCRLPGLSTSPHCYPDVTDNTGGLHSYQPITDEHVTVKFAWIPQLSIRQCLMQIITRNDSIIDIYINSANQIMIEITDNKSIKSSKYNSYQISSTDVHALSMGFIDHKLTIRISNGYFIKTRMLPNQFRVETINIGWNSNPYLCQPIRGKFGIQLNSNLKSAVKWDASRCPKVPQKNAKCPKELQKNASQFLNPFLWSSIIINIALMSILLLIIGKRIIDHRHRKEITRRNSNVYEEQQQELSGINLTSLAIQRLGIGENVDGGHRGTANVTNLASDPQDEANEYDYGG